MHTMRRYEPAFIATRIYHRVFSATAQGTMSSAVHVFHGSLNLRSASIIRNPLRNADPDSGADRDSLNNARHNFFSN